MATLQKSIGYIRVSKVRRPKDGLAPDGSSWTKEHEKDAMTLGLQAQTRAIHEYAAANGYQVLDIYKDVESGAHDDRPELEKALRHAKAVKGVIITKLDRLSRHLQHFCKMIEEVPIKFWDHANADKFTLHIMASVAEKERGDISKRVKAALHEVKSAGRKLGSPAGFKYARNEDNKIHKMGAAASAKVRHANMIEFLKTVGPMVAMSYENEDGHCLATAKNLEGKGITTRCGRTKWSLWTVRNVFKNLKKYDMLQEAIKDTLHKDDPDYFLSADRRRFFKSEPLDVVLDEADI